MAGATEGLDLNQALDVQSNVAAQVALNDDVSLIDVVTDLSFFFQSQVLDAGIGVDASCFQDLVSSGLTDTVNVGETHLNALLAGQVNAGNTCHSSILQNHPMSVSGSAPGLYALDPQAPELALALLMLGVLADDHHAAFAADDLALFADGFHGRLDLHDVEPPFG